MSGCDAVTGLASAWLPTLVRIEDVRVETPGVRSYQLEFVEDAQRNTFTFQSGQFNMLYLPGVGESAISISSAPGEPLLHTVRAVGRVTGSLSRMNVGDTLGLRGPFGSAWPLDFCLGEDLLIAGGGIGLAPLRPVIREVCRRRPEFGRVHLLYGARRPADLLYRHEYADWVNSGIEMEVTVDLADEDWTGHIGVVPNLFGELQVEARRTRVFTCGPEIMMRYVIQAAQSRGIDNRRIYLSMERNMSCGMGFCGHCQLGPEFICKDGPVFDFETIEPYMHLEDL